MVPAVAEVMYACHSDVAKGEEPEACLMDDDRGYCVHGMRLKSKEQCKHWKPIMMISSMNTPHSHAAVAASAAVAADALVTPARPISAQQLANLVSTLLIDPESLGQLCEASAFSSFMTDIAQVVADHCGGQVHSPAAMNSGVWAIDFDPTSDPDDQEQSELTISFAGAGSIESAEVFSAS